MSGCQKDLDVPPVQVGGLRGTLQTASSPVAGAPVLLTSELGVTFALTSSETGAFAREDLAPGRWDLDVTAPGFVPLALSVTIVAGQTRDLGVLALYSSATVDPNTSGTLQGVVHVNGAPDSEVQGGTVEVLVASTMSPLATTALGSAGRFALQLPPGTYLVRASHPYFVTASVPDVVITARAAVSLPDNALVMALNPGRVTGVVRREVSGQSARVPAAGITVSSETGASTTTAADGTFDLGGLPGGARTLRFVGAGLHDVQAGRGAVVQPGGSVSLPDVELLLDRGDVAGTVVMGDGSSLHDVTVFIEGTTFSAVAVPVPADPAAGAFTIRGVPVGAYSVSASRAGYATVSSGVFSVLKDQTVTVSALPAMTRVQGDFSIDDGDATNSPGFTRARAVLLALASPSGVASYRAAETNPQSANLPFSPFGADGGTGIAFFLSAGDGEKTVFLQLKDSLGSVGPVLNANVVLDSTPPVGVTLQLGDGSGFLNTANPLPFSLSGNDPLPSGGRSSGLAFMRLALGSTVDGQGNLTGPRQPYLRDDSFVRPTSTEGPLTVFAQLIDNAGNVSAVASASTVVDVTPPSGTVAVLRGADATQDGYTSSWQVTLQVATTPEPFAGVVRVRLANDPVGVNFASPIAASPAVGWALDPLVDGTKTVSARFVDSAGNQSGPQQATIVLDRVPPAPLSPAISLAVLTSPTVTNSRTVTLAATVSDERLLSPTEAVLVSLDGVASTLPPTSTTSVSGSLPFTLPDVDGAHALRLRFKDAAGNATAPVDFFITLDRSAPDATLALQGALKDGTPSSTLTASASARVVLGATDATGVFLSTSAIATCPGTASSYLALTDPLLAAYPLGVSTGTATVSACLRDAAGNTRSLIPAAITVDTTAPSGCQVQLSGKKKSGGAAPAGKTGDRDVAAVLGGCSETPTEAFLASLAAAPACTGALPWSGFSGAVPVKLDLGDGLQTVRGCVRDAAGNVSAVTAGSITLDTTPPAAAAVVLNGGTSTVNRGQVAPGATFTSSVTATATGAVEWSFGETIGGLSAFAALPAMPTTVAFPNAADGARALLVRFRDDVGNDTDLVQTALTFDLLAPSGLFRLEGTLGDGTPSTSLTSNTSVVVDVVQAGASGVYLTTGALGPCPASAASYLSLTDPSLSAFPLGALSGLVTVSGCLRDDAGNTFKMPSAVITIDGAAPAGCSLQLAGTRTDGTPAVAGQTAWASVGASLSGCTETAVDVVVIENPGPLICSALASLPWRPLSTLSPLALSAVDGPHTVGGCVRDAAHNVGALASSTMNVDTTPPSGVAVAVNGDAAYIGAGQVTAGSHTASFQGQATGATEWAVGASQTVGAFSAFPGTNPKTAPIPVTADGVLTLYARFRDAVGNETLASDTITADINGPATPILSVLPTGDAGFVNSEVVTVVLQGMSGATSMALAEAATLAACTTALDAASLQAAVGAPTLVMSPQEGSHVLCVRAQDPAGNLSGVASAAVTLDKTPPTRPVIITPDGYASLADGAGATVDIALPSTDLFLHSYQRLGGTASRWTDVVPSAPGTRFALPVRNDGAEEGFRNELRLRAVDEAGNASAESLVLITADTNPPEAASVDVRWVDNGNRQGSVYWKQPTSNDVDYYEVTYDAAPVTPLGGTYANEGVAPLRIPATGPIMNTSLSGLTNGSPTYVQVIPVDRAGNRAPADAGLVLVQPNDVSPNLVATLDLAPLTHAWAMEQFDGYLYVAGSQHPVINPLIPADCGTLGDLRLLTYDVRRLVAPVQGGTINATSTPALTSTQTYVGAFDCTGWQSGLQMDLEIDPPWLILSSGNAIRIYDITLPETPVLRSTLTLQPATTRTPLLDLIGDVLFVSTYAGPGLPGNLFSISLATLFDNNAGTAPALPAASIGQFDAGAFLPGTAFVTRDVLLQLEINSGSPSAAVRLADALDNNVGTLWNPADAWFRAPLAAPPYVQAQGKPIVSGNYAYFPMFSSNTVGILPLAPFWTGTNPGATGFFTLPSTFSAISSFALAGSEFHLPDPNSHSLRIVDGQDLSDPVLLSNYDLGSGGASRVVTFGNYEAVLVNALGGTFNAPYVQILETASPRSPSIEMVLDTAGLGRPEVRAGFVIMPGRPTVYDLHASPLPTMVNDGVFNYCGSGATHFEDTEVVAYGRSLRIINLDSMLDRNPGTTLGAIFPECTATPPAHDYCVAHPVAGTRIADVAAWGNYLVAAELRASGAQVWLEVFDARPLRDKNGTTTINLAAPVATQLVYTGAGGTSSSATLDMTQGFAIMTYQENPNQMAPGRVLAFDLRAAFDDNAATTVAASGLQASFTLPNVADGGVTQPRDARFSGSTLYVASNRGVWAIPAAELNDGIAGTVTNGAGAVGAMPGYAFDDLQVSGSSIIASPGFYGNFGQGQALAIFDTSKAPTSLVPAGFLPLPYPSTGSYLCNMSTDVPAFAARKIRGGVTVKGSRAYVRNAAQSGKLNIIRLE